MSWFTKSKTSVQPIPDCANSILFDENTFYNKFNIDLLNAKSEVVIESPFITLSRLSTFKPIFEKLITRNVKVYVVTRNPKEHDGMLVEQAETGIRYFEALGVQVLLWQGGHHRKLAIIDREILWEGSLNILSQRHSREFMRRIDSKKLAEEMIKFLRYDKAGII